MKYKRFLKKYKTNYYVVQKKHLITYLFYSLRVMVMLQKIFTFTLTYKKRNVFSF